MATGPVARVRGTRDRGLGGDRVECGGRVNARSVRALGLIVAFAAAAALARLAFLWFPNGSPIYFIIFIAGAAFGARIGATSGALAMVLTDLLLSAVHPIVFANAFGMAVVGVAGAGAARVMDLGQHARGTRGDRFVASAFAGGLGLTATLAFSVFTDAATWLVFDVPSGAGTFPVLAAITLAGIVFTIPSAVANTALFAVATWPPLRALARADLIHSP